MKIAALLFLVSLVACGGESSVVDGGLARDAAADAGFDASTDDVDVYDPDHLLFIEITLPPASWDALREQTRDFMETLGGDCLAAPFGSPFTWFEASVTIDGTRYPRVEVRKKGFLGSLSSTRPSLKIDLGEFVDDQTYGGMRRLTLNNSREDAALLRQCLGYLVFERAGLPAPRCSFARVAVNGEDLGVYVNVEPINNAFTERAFGSDEGNLYEGTISDFRPEMLATFEPKNNGEELGRSELAELSAALMAEDEALLDALAPLIDVDEFLTFWAVESLLEHRDGYNAFRNNFYVYRDPATDLFRFIPWGVDIVFTGRGGSVYAESALAYRLYQLPEVRDRYYERLDSLLETAWDEDVLDAEVSRMQALIEPALGARRSSVLSSIEELRGHIAERRGRLGEPRVLGAFPAPFMCQ